MKRRSLGWIFKRHEPWYKGVTWYIGYCVDEVVDGRRVRRKIREAVGPKKADASARLARRLRELDDGKWQHPTKPLTLDDVLALVKSDWRNQGRKSALTLSDGKREQSGIRRLRERFGAVEITTITALQLERYSNERQDKGAAVSTVRNELNVLKHGMNLACEKDLLAKVPPFPTLTPKNIRTGYFERHELDTILAELPERVRPVVLAMYWTGWRKNEVLSRRWENVDLQAGTIRLEPGETKNGEGRTYPFSAAPELQAMIAAQLAYTKVVERRTGQIVPFVFHRDGRPIKSFRTAWRAASRRSGIARIPHDFRRTAVRNLETGGISRTIAMKIVGHKTESIYRRYHIVNDQDMRDAVAKLAAAAQDKQVLPLKRKAGTR